MGASVVSTSWLSNLNFLGEPLITRQVPSAKRLWLHLGSTGKVHLSKTSQPPSAIQGPLDHLMLIQRCIVLQSHPPVNPELLIQALINEGGQYTALASLWFFFLLLSEYFNNEKYCIQNQSNLGSNSSSTIFWLCDSALFKPSAFLSLISNEKKMPF